MSVSVSGWQSMVSVCGVVSVWVIPRCRLGSSYWGDDGFRHTRVGLWLVWLWV